MPVSIDESLVISPNPTPSSLDPAIDAAVAPTAVAAGITGHPPNEQYTKALDVQGVPIGPGQRTYEADSTTPDPHGSYFLLGADRLGRDQLVRVLYGLRVSL